MYSNVDDDIDYEAIEARVKHRIQRRYRFFFHTVLFIIGIPIIARWNSPELFLVWVAMWASHLLWVNYQANLEDAIAEEVERERVRQYKAKRDAATAYDLHDPTDDEREDHLRWLGDDGEFIDAYDYDTQDQWHDA